MLQRALLKPAWCATIIAAFLVSALFPSRLLAADSPALFLDARIARQALTPNAWLPSNARNVSLTTLNPAARALLQSLLAGESTEIILNFSQADSRPCLFQRIKSVQGRSLLFCAEIEDTFQGSAFLTINGNSAALAIFSPGVPVRISIPIPDGLQANMELDPDLSPGCGITAANAIQSSTGSLPAMTPPKRGIATMSGPSAPAPVTNQLDLMVVYTPLAREQAGGTTGINALIDLALAESNYALVQSRIQAEINLVYAGETPYSDSGSMQTDLNRIAGRTDGFMDEIHAIRSTVKADLISLIVEKDAGNGVAGLGNLMTAVSTTFADSAFNVLRRQYIIGNFTLMHEIGHNLGCMHDRENSITPGVFPFSYGVRFVAAGVTNRTIMAAYPGLQAPHFSNPEVLYAGVPTGMATNTSNAANNALTINLTAPTATYFASAPARLSFDTQSLDVSETAGFARISVLRTGDLSTQTTRILSVQSGSAREDLDFIASDTAVTFDANQEQFVLLIPILDNFLQDGDRSFSLTLAPIPGSSNIISGAITNLIVHILDNETPRNLMVNLAGTMNLSPNYRVDALLPQSDGSLLVGGGFSAIGTTPRNRLARILPGGLTDTNYMSGRGVKYRVLGIAGTLDGSAAIAGEFNTVNGTLIQRIARLDGTGNLAAGFEVGTGPGESVAAVASGTNRIYIGGQFISFNGASRSHIAALLFNGQLDTSFDPGSGADDVVNAIVVDTTGRVIIGGNFLSINGATRTRLARLLPSGTLDATFSTTLDAPVLAMAPTADQRLWIGGTFTNVNGLSRPSIARLNTNGTLDSTLTTPCSANAAVRALWPMPDGSVLIGGDFTSVNGAPRNRLARLLPTGGLDTTFNTGVGPDDSVRTIAITKDGSIWVGGLFRHIDGNPTPFLAKLWPAAGNPSAAPQFTGVLAARGFRAATLAGASYQIETSSDLNTWTQGTAFVSTNAVLDLPLPNDSAPAKFYRLKRLSVP